MKKVFIAALMLLFTSIWAQAQIDTKYLVRNWKVIKIGEQETATEGFVMIFKFSTEGVITMGSEYSVQAADYELKEGNIIHVNVGDMHEDWIIKKLTETEFIYTEKTIGDVTLLATQEGLPAIVAPVEDLPLEEMPTEELVEAPAAAFSIETTRVPSKKDAKLLAGTWEMQTIGGEPAPSGASLSFTFTDKGVLTVLANESPMPDANWKFSSDKKNLEIDFQDRKPATWGIKQLDATQLILLDVEVGEFVLKRKDKKKH